MDEALTRSQRSNKAMQADEVAPSLRSAASSQLIAERWAYQQQSFTIGLLTWLTLG